MLVDKLLQVGGSQVDIYIYGEDECDGFLMICDAPMWR